MGADFEIVEHTADIGIVACGSTLEETFAAAARGMFSIMVDLDEIRPETPRDVKVWASDLELLLVEWLTELLFIFETEYLLFSRFEVSFAAEGQLLARAWGERINLERHHIGTGIKAVTRHMLSLERRDGYRATVIFDV